MKLRYVSDQLREDSFSYTLTNWKSRLRHSEEGAAWFDKNPHIKTYNTAYCLGGTAILMLLTDGKGNRV